MATTDRHFKVQTDADPSGFHSAASAGPTVNVHFGRFREPRATSHEYLLPRAIQDDEAITGVSRVHGQNGAGLERLEGYPFLVAGLEGHAVKRVTPWYQIARVGTSGLRIWFDWFGMLIRHGIHFLNNDWCKGPASE